MWWSKKEEIEEEEIIDGYFMRKEPVFVSGGWIFIRTEGRIVDRSKTEFRIRYRAQYYSPLFVKWMPKEKFVRYRTLREVDEIVKVLEEKLLDKPKD